MKYAEKTRVPESQSRSEIEKTLMRYGATGFMYGWHEGKAVIAFEMERKRIKFLLPLPDEKSDDIRLTSKGWERSDTEKQKAFSQATRQRWRALLLCVKSKLESVESGIETFEEAFLPHIVLPDGNTIGAWIVPQIEIAYAENKMPPMLGTGGKK